MSKGPDKLSSNKIINVNEQEVVQEEQMWELVQKGQAWISKLTVIPIARKKNFISLRSVAFFTIFAWNFIFRPHHFL